MPPSLVQVVRRSVRGRESSLPLDKAAEFRSAAKRACRTPGVRVEVSVLNHRIVRAGQNKRFTVYDVAMRCDGGDVALRWTARRRYSSFDALQKVGDEWVGGCVGEDEWVGE